MKVSYSEPLKRNGKHHTESGKPMTTERCGLRILPLAALGMALLALSPRVLFAQDDDLNAKVLAYARSKVGKTVGRGECTDLATGALVAAGASLGVKRAQPVVGSYAWGQPIATCPEALPGDIIQIHQTRQNGSNTEVVAHHTAIVVAYLGNGKFKVLHQNAGGHRVVQEGELSIKSKSAWIYRPEK
jgi:hypothetical protein